MKNCMTPSGIEPTIFRPMGAKFSALVKTGLGAHLASDTAGTVCLEEAKRPEPGVGHATPSSAEVKERVELYLYSPLGLRSLF